MMWVLRGTFAIVKSRREAVSDLSQPHQSEVKGRDAVLFCDPETEKERGTEAGSWIYPQLLREQWIIWPVRQSLEPQAR